MLDRLPSSLQHHILLEWISPSTACAVARAGSTELRRAVLTSPFTFRAAKDEVLSDACIRWFQTVHVSLVLWTTVKPHRRCWIVHCCNGKIHRDDDLPAVVRAKVCQKWYQKGQKHRDGDRPAVKWADGRKEWFQNDQLHRDGDRPAVVDLGMKKWYQNGKLHRDGDLPAVVCLGLKEWYQNDELHRDGDLPAVIKAFLGNEWYQNGQKHRDGDEPAVVNWKAGTREWWKHGELHRDGGPAVIRADGTEIWYQNGCVQST